jgi:hypothetical protein
MIAESVNGSDDVVERRKMAGYRRLLIGGLLTLNCPSTQGGL